MNKIEFYSTPVEDVFRIFYDYVSSSGGDGCGLLVCKNYEEAAFLFLSWLESKSIQRPCHKLYSYDRIINFHDNNENFMFSDIIQDLDHGDPTFIIRQDCYTYRQVSFKEYNKLEKV